MMATKRSSKKQPVSDWQPGSDHQKYYAGLVPDWPVWDAPPDVIAAVRTQKKLKAAGSKGGAESGRTRRENRKWVTHATDRLREAFAQNRALSQDGFVTEIQGSWKLADIKCPGTSTLKPFVSKELPKLRQSAKPLRLAK